MGFQLKNWQTKDDFLVNDLITICNVLCIGNFRSYDEIAARIVSYLYDLNIVKLHIIPEDNDNSDNEVENNSNSSTDNNSSS